VLHRDTISNAPFNDEDDPADDQRLDYIIIIYLQEVTKCIKIQEILWLKRPKEFQRLLRSV
jgi:hypothetical protein